MQPVDNKNIIISIKSIYKSFETGERYTNVLRNVSLDIYQGEFVIIFGPSGCGKSTLLHAIMGLERPDAGIVELEGMDLWKISTEDRTNIRKREIGIMYQQQNWIKSLDVLENISFSGQLIGLEKEEAIIKAEEVLNLVGMSQRASYVPSELSAGEQQKIGVARALMTNPKILIADEPTGNLDVKSGQEMMTLLNNLSKSGKTIIMVTHNPEYLKYANRVVFMLDGKIRRQISVTEANAQEVERQITADLKSFIAQDPITEQEANIPTPLSSKEIFKKRNIFQSLFYAISFNLRFLFQIILFALLWIANLKPFRASYPTLKKSFASISRKLDRNPKENISSSINTLDLTEISFRNLWVKKSRTNITITGMAIGIGFIVFLLSLGYGLERLVINEVTKIEDLKQVDIMPTVSSNVILDKENIARISKIEWISTVMPLINMAARVEYDQSSTDIVVYGVEPEYITNSPVTVSFGKIFDTSTPGVVVNEEFLTTIGVAPNDALGKSLKVNFVSMELSEENQQKDKTYNIVGVVSDNNPAVIYVPIEDLEKLGVTEYSQLRLVVSNEEQIPEVRRQIEVLGFETTSVTDTISDVESLFSYAKIGLIVVGTIALSIAILGMFNTLTVSLLERTREVGLMKTIGMKADEIRSLFINESMLMGIAGGSLGVLLGLFLGFLVSLALSIFSMSKGGGYITVNFLPWTVMLGIVVLSTFVGFLTGLYPSNRAVKMAPLDALRYE